MSSLCPTVNLIELSSGLPNYNTPVLNSCNLMLIMNVIRSLNQVWLNSIKSYPNSKIRFEFYFSFEFGLPLVKIPNAEVVPNVLIYL
jgi:hypothetical protein